MRTVYIIGAGQVPVTKRSDVRGRHLAGRAIRAALADARLEARDVTALMVGNMMSGMLADQQQLGALFADVAGLRGVEAATVEAACGSGAAAARWGYMCVAGGFHDVVVVCGMERMTHAPKDKTTAALATAADWELEGCMGESFLSLNATLMTLYMQRWQLEPRDFGHFAINAHHNALGNPNALLRKAVDMDAYLASPPIVPPVKLLDAPPICDGSAAVVFATEDIARSSARAGRPPVRIRGSAIGTDSLALKGRRDPLYLDGAALSAARALAQAGLRQSDMDLFELHDAYTVITALSLEAAGFAEPGRGAHFGKDGEIAIDGRLPISTMGGLKARGHPVGATGVYQLAETYLQLTDQAGANQVPNAEVAMVQNIGGTGATVVTHILTRES
jgi:acetyl-CoA C-acetyltransferase